MISDDVLAFLGGGKSVVVGTCDSQLCPEAARAAGLRPHLDRTHVSLFLPDAVCARTLQNLRDNGRIAIGLSYPPDHRSLQLKGVMTDMAAATEEDLAFVRTYLAALAAELSVVGLPEHVVLRVNYEPCTRVVVRVAEIFDQTPGPEAGRRLVGGAP